MPDFPSAFAAICDVPTANAVTTPSVETLTIFGSCTVQVIVAPGTSAPDASRTCACNGSWASIASVEIVGLTTIVATCGGASGAVPPAHDQLDSATQAIPVNVRPLVDMSLFPRLSTVWSGRTSASTDRACHQGNRSIRSACGVLEFTQPWRIPDAQSPASTLKSLPGFELPLLGSNQDSPDPESGVLPVTPRGSTAFDCHGAEGDRTPDLCSAIAALSQLSYSPRDPSREAGN